MQVRNLENFNAMPKKAEDAYGGSRELSCLALQVFPGPRTQDNEVRGFFIAFREG